MKPPNHQLHTSSTKTFIEIVLEMESRGEVPPSGLLCMYQRELDGFYLEALQEVVDRMEQLYPDSARIAEMRDKIHYRKTHGLIDGGM